MLRHLVAVLLLLVPIPALAVDDDCSADLAALEALYAVRAEMLEATASTYSIDSRIDELLDRLRGPLGDGSYKWVRYVRPAGDAPLDKKEHLVQSIEGTDEPETFDVEGRHLFAVRVAVPRKRSTFKANNAVWVGSVEIRYWVDGRMKTMTKDINAWLQPDTVKSYDLGAIAERAEVTLATATKAATRKESLVEVQFRQAVPQDDPANPSYETIQVLKKLREESGTAGADIAFDSEIARLEKRLFPGVEPVPLITITRRLREAEALMKSQKIDEYEAGRKLFYDTMRLLPR